MSCGLPLEFFEDGGAGVQRLETTQAEHGVIAFAEELKNAATWSDTLQATGRHLELVRQVRNQGAFIYWVKVAPLDGLDGTTYHSQTPEHYLITWQTWFELRRRRML